MNLSQKTEVSLNHECYQYGDHDRQSVGVWHRGTPQIDGRWVM